MSIPRFAVFGHPVAHSRSPWIHSRFARELGIALDYTAIDTPPERFLEALFDFAEDGGRGANVTLPLKELAATACDELSDTAARAGAVNTLIALPGRRWRGDNTDGVGLLADLARLGIALREQRVLILGAGGAVRGILAPLLAAAPATLDIANRTFARAAQLAAEFSTPGSVGAISPGNARVAMRAIELHSLAQLPSYDLIIHASSAFRGSLSPSLPAASFGSNSVVYDLSYGAAAKSFIEAASALGIRHAYDGLGMLIEQAAESFERWHGRRPDTAPMHAELRLLVDGG